MGIEYIVGKFPLAANSRARANDDSRGSSSLSPIKRRENSRRAHIVAGGAGEILSECVLAMEYGATAEDIARTCRAPHRVRSGERGRHGGGSPNMGSIHF